MRTLLLVTLLATTLGACKKTGEGEYQVQVPDVDVNVQRDSATVRVPDVDVGSTRDTVTAPTTRNDTLTTKQVEVQRPTVNVSPNERSSKQP